MSLVFQSNILLPVPAGDQVFQNCNTQLTVFYIVLKRSFLKCPGKFDRDSQSGMEKAFSNFFQR